MARSQPTYEWLGHPATRFHPDKPIGEAGQFSIESAGRAGLDGARKGPHPGSEVFFEKTLS
jgi:hypothetical protein